MSNNHARAMKGARNFYLEVAKGNVPGHSVLHKWGHNPDVGTAAYEHVWFDGGSYTWLETAAAIRVQAGGNAADDVAGLGARSIVAQGKSDQWEALSATLVTAGASASASSAGDFFRVDRCFVDTCGTYGGSNTGDMHIETAAGVVLGHIEAGLGQSQQAHYTVAKGHTLYIHALRLGVFSSKTASIRFCIRLNADDTIVPVSPMRVISEWNGLEGQHQFDATPPYVFPEYTDIWLDAKADGASATDVYAEFDGILVEN